MLKPFVQRGDSSRSVRFWCLYDGTNADEMVRLLNLQAPNDPDSKIFYLAGTDPENPSYAVLRIEDNENVYRIDPGKWISRRSANSFNSETHSSLAEKYFSPDGWFAE